MNRKDKRRTNRQRQRDLHDARKARRDPPPSDPERVPASTFTAPPPPPPTEPPPDALRAGGGAGQSDVDKQPRTADQRADYATRWQPGQSGNPTGYSRQRRIASAFHDLMDKNTALANDVATTVFMKALGQRIKDREPDLAWLHFLHDVVDGPIPRRTIIETDNGMTPPSEAHAPTLDPLYAERLMAAVDPGTIPLLEDDDDAGTNGQSP